MTSPPDNAMTRCGFAAIIGAPNAGKSTLINRLVGAKVCIVTHKVQTTRARIRAIAIKDLTQIVFVDTPGIFAPKRTLDEAMVAAAWDGAENADTVVLLIDAKSGLTDEARQIVGQLAKAGTKAVLALNKIDLVKREQLLAIADACNQLHSFTDTFMISAETGSGVEDLKNHIADRLPVGPWLYPEDQIADLPMRLLAAEITREKLYLRLHQELPYASTVETESWKQQKDGSVRIEQVIYVERESQRKIVLGKGGQTIKALGQTARKDIAEAIDQPVHLFLFVKVRKNWGSDPERLKMMGL
ncbi:MAG: GTPase Era [Rhizobiales bacterium]|nr:GTPase Era [Hyphomicrobiales bacterium]